jgi:hypothetical protein
MKQKDNKQKKTANDILIRIKEAQDYKDWGDLSDILYNATKNDIKALKPLIPNLINHHDWLIRASTVEVIGDFRLRQFMGLVKVGLEDRHPVVRAYALMAYYDILGKKALPVIEEFCITKEINPRVTALTLHYIETSDNDTFKKLSRILKRKRCRSMHRATTLNNFEHYLDVRAHSEIVNLYKNILLEIPKSHGLASEIKRICLKSGNSKKKNKNSEVVAKEQK